MNRIYVPYPIELLAKIISWFVVIVIDVTEFVLAPFMRIGLKCITVFTTAAAILTGYVYFTQDLALAHAAVMFGAIVAAFLASLLLLRGVKHVLIKVIRPPFAAIVFESVAVSFRRPMRGKKAKVG